MKYDPIVAQQFEALWGDGFLSPGGAEEVRLIVDGFDLSERKVLDIGVGLGGPAIVLSGELGAQVTGIDTQEQMIEDARRRIADAELSRRVDLEPVEPGLLPFPDQSFDMVFSKDVIIHVAEKATIYEEIFRVLRPGGALAISDWMMSPEDPAVVAFLGAVPLDLNPASLEDTLSFIDTAGFNEVSTVDRNAWYVQTVREEQEALHGSVGRRFESIIGRQGVEAWIARREPMRIAAETGAIRPTHIRARRPVQ